MNKNPNNSYYAHQEYFLLLPWYVNNSLRDSELKAVENHLKVCLLCKREVAFLQSFAQTVNDPDPLETAAQTSFSRLKKRIRQSEGNNLLQKSEEASPLQNPAKAERKWYENLQLNFFRFPEAAMVMMTVLLVMIVVPGYWLVGPMQTGAYRTLSSSEPVSSKINEIRVIFTKNSSKQQISDVLNSIHGKIIDGPSETGVYVVLLPVDPSYTDSQKVADSIKTLRKNDKVIFAEPAYALASPADSPRAANQ